MKTIRAVFYLALVCLVVYAFYDPQGGAAAFKAIGKLAIGAAERFGAIISALAQH